MAERSATVSFGPCRFPARPRDRREREFGATVAQGALEGDDASPVHVPVETMSAGWKLTSAGRGKRRIEIIGNDEPSSKQAERAVLWRLR